MKRTQLLLTALVAFLPMCSSYASDIQTKIQSALGGDHPIVVNDYDGQLKEVLVDSNVYFATHDGRYLFAGPILDTERATDIVAAKEDHLRQAYLASLPQELFVNYPSSGPIKHQVTVFTDIDCPYCRKMHNHMPSFNQQGISVNYLMLPRAGVGSASHKKTVSAICSTDPAGSVTSAMQNNNPAPLSCEPNLVRKHMEIARKLKIRSTPTIVLPSGQLKIGLTNPGQLIALLERGE